MKIRTDALDILFSKYIRRRAMKRQGGCERCLSRKKSSKELHTAHFHGRSSKSVRWDESNACGLCMGCHSYLDGHPLEKVEFFKMLLGQEEFDMLNSRVRNTWPRPDKKLLQLYYTQKIKEFDEQI